MRVLSAPPECWDFRLVTQLSCGCWRSELCRGHLSGKHLSTELSPLWGRSFAEALHPFLPGWEGPLKPPQCSVFTQWCWSWGCWCRWYGKECWLNPHIRNMLWQLIWRSSPEGSKVSWVLPFLMSSRNYCRSYFKSLHLKAMPTPPRWGLPDEIVTSHPRHLSLSLWKGPSPQTKVT